MKVLYFAFMLGLACLGATQPMSVRYDKVWGGALQDSFQSVAVQANGSTFVSGLSTPLASVRTARILAYGSTGDIIWSKTLSVGGTPTDTQVVLSDGALFVRVDTTVSGARFHNIARMNPADGSVIWQIEQPGQSVSPMSVRANRVAVAHTQTGATLFGVTQRNGNSGSVTWNRGLELSQTNPRMLHRNDGAVFIQTSDLQSGMTRVLCLAAASGAPLWTRSFQGNVSASMALVGTALGVCTPGSPSVFILSTADGSLLRTQPLPVGQQPEQLISGVGGSFYAITSATPRRFHLFSEEGYHLASGTLPNPAVLAVEPFGNLIAAHTKVNAQQIAEVVLTSLPAGVTQTIPLPIATNVSGVSAGGAHIAVSGTVQLTTTNQKGRVLVVTPRFAPGSRAFVYRPGRVLNVSSPGFLTHGVGLNGTVPSIGIAPAQGSASVSANGTLRYTPPTGFSGQTSLSVDTLNTATLTLIRRQYPLVPIKLSSIEVRQNGQAVSSVVGGESAAGTVALTTSNPFTGLIVQLSSSMPALQVTSSALVNLEATSTTFNVVTTPVSADQVGTIKATLDGITVSIPFAVLSPRLARISLSRTSVQSFARVSGSVELTGKAAGAPFAVTLAATGPLKGMPTSVSIPVNAKIASFAGEATEVSTTTPATITASSQGTTVSAQLSVNPLNPTFAIDDTVLPSNGLTTARINLPFTPTVTIPYTLAASGEGLEFPPSGTIPANTSSGAFAVRGRFTTTAVTRSLTLTIASVTRTVTVQVQPGNFFVDVSPTQVVSGSPSLGRVSLPTPSTANQFFALTADGNAVSLPAFITVSAGATFATFDIQTSPVAFATTRTIRATADSVQRSTTLTLTPALFFKFNISPESLAGGGTAVGAVQLLNTASQDVVFSISKDGGSVSAPATTTIPAGSIKKSFSMPTSPVATITVRTITVSANGFAITKTLTLQP